MQFKETDALENIKDLPHDWDDFYYPIILSKVDINGMEGIIIEKDGVTIISWHDNNRSFYLQGEVEKSVLLEIVKNIEKNK